MREQMGTNKFNKFIEIANKLNDIEIIPLLMGSVGLEVVTGTCWNEKKKWLQNALQLNEPEHEWLQFLSI
ncbi:hypothetical protein [Bacillus sp. 1P02SD]|uniref:hypothetical protein n=1 Tax=Bacillus sp. 1P02SD TaxID=3132264 RepID=UPI0039A37414